MAEVRRVQMRIPSDEERREMMRPWEEALERAHKAINRLSTRHQPTRNRIREAAGNISMETVRLFGVDDEKMTRAELLAALRWMAERWRDADPTIFTTTRQQGGDDAGSS